MRERHIPYIVGGFMLLPYGFWLIAWALFLPGPKYGFDQPLSTALFAVTVPLVAWFFLANLGSMSNSIAGGDALQQPATRWVRWVLAKLPATAVLIGGACVPYLLASGEPPLMAPLPLLMAVVVAWAIRRGEAARKHEAAGATRAASPARPSRGGAVASFGRAALAVMFRLPVVGRVLREAIHGKDEDRMFFALNLALLAVLLVLVFGVQALFLLALASVPIAFLFILMLTAG